MRAEIKNKITHVISKWNTPDARAAFFYYAFLTAGMLFFVFLQPLGEPPDESGHYKVVQYICLHGRLPHGADPEIQLFGYGGSYAFQPILTYIVQGFLLRFLFSFCRDGYLLLTAARLVNVACGLVMAVYVRKTARLLFAARPAQWLFAVLVMFLPQSLFLHTYVNMDSLAMLSTAILLYAWLRGFASRWDRGSCLTLAVGLSLCALSYYNAYGFLLCSIPIAVYPFLDFNNSRFLWRDFGKRALAVSALVLLLAGWWFLRSAILYDGDFLGLAAREAAAQQVPPEQISPLIVGPYRDKGASLWDMLAHSDFLTLLGNSTIATFGPMSIVTFPHIYRIIKCLALLGVLGCLLPRALSGGLPQRAAARTDAGHADQKVSTAPSDMPDESAAAPSGIQNACAGSGAPDARPLPLQDWEKRDRRFFSGILLLAIAIPVALGVAYSYYSDYQPQGRYIMPMLLPLAYFLTLGLQNLLGLLARLLRQPPLRLQRAAGVLITAFYSYAVWATLLLVLFPVYYPTSFLHYLRHMP